jgi:hypothetical protein
MSQQQSTVNSRFVYDNALKICAQYKIDPVAAKLTQSDIILEQALSTGLTQYVFPVLTNDNGPSGTRFPTEIRLQLQDSFIASSWGAFLLEPTGSANDCTFIAQTYPNPQVFVGVGEAKALETIYNSYCKITVNNDVILPVWSLSRHRYVPETQQEPLIAGVENAIPYSEIDLSQDGFMPVEPNIIFVGSKGYQIQVILPAAMAVLGAFTRLRLHYRGINAQNTTIIT